MIGELEVIQILKRVGAIVENSHFVGTSGRHLDAYITKDALFPHTAETSRVGELFAIKNQDLDAEAVVAPALGGIILAQWTAHHLSHLKNKEVLAVYTEKTAEGGQAFTRGYDSFVRGKKILVLEDLTTTGGSVRKVVEAVRETSGEVLRVCVMVNRDPVLVNAETMGAPFAALGEYSVKSYSAEECPLCAQGIPINTTYGHGKKFVTLKK